MKKYIAPEVEIKTFAVESIMTGSEIENTITVGTGDVASANAKGTVDYDTLFGLNN